MDTWDTRDQQLQLPKRFAQLVAEKVSGVPTSEPEEFDYELADEIGALIERRTAGETPE